MAKTIQEMMNQMFRYERDNGLMDLDVMNRTIQVFEQMEREVRKQHPESADQFLHIALGMNLINTAAFNSFNSHGGDRTMERGLGYLENMWQFLDGQSPEDGLTNYQWMVKRMPEAADDLDAGLDELDSFTGIEEEARQERTNPYQALIKDQQETLEDVLHGTDTKNGLLYTGDVTNDYDAEFAYENRLAARDECREAIATILAAHSLFMNPSHSRDRRVKPGALEAIAGPIKESSAFQLLTSKTKLEGLEEMGELAQDPTLAMEKLEKAQRVASRIQDRSRGLVEQLKGTTQKSFAGKLKSWFVGNSQEYETALADMEAVVEGTGDVHEAVDSVKAYLKIRRDKVRDHEYGRERFDGMMRFLQSALTPTAFSKYCDEVNADRLRVDPQSKSLVNPEDYYPERSVRELVDAQAKIAQGKDYKPTQRETARLVAAMQMGLDDQQKPLDSKALRERADRIEKDPNFQEWFDSRKPGEIQRMMTQNPVEMGAYEDTLVQEYEKLNQEAAERNRQFKEFQQRSRQGEGREAAADQPKPKGPENKGPET